MSKLLINILIITLFFSCSLKENKSSLQKCNCDELQLDLLYNHFYLKDRKEPYTGLCYILNKKIDTLETRTYLKGKVDGILTKYYESGNKLSETTFSHNKYHGDHKEWDENGNLIFHCIYKKGSFDTTLVDYR